MVAKYAIPFFYFILPFQWALFSGGGHDVALARVFILGIVFCWLATVLEKKKIMLLRPLPLFLLLGFLGMSGASILWADYEGPALSKWIFWLNFFPLLFVLFSELGEKSMRIRALKALVLGAGVSALLGMVQFLSQFVVGIERAYAFWTSPLPFFLGENFAQSVLEYPSFLVNLEGVTVLRSFAFFPDPHIYGYFLGMTLPVAIWLAFQEKQKLYFFISALLSVSLLLTFSRSAYVALLILVPVAFLFLVQHSRYSVSPQAILITVGLVILLVLSPVSNRFLSSFSFEDNSVTERWRLANEALSHIAERPVFGIGLGNYPFLVKPTAGEREPIYAHNLYLDLGVEIGLLGMLFFLGLVGIALISGFQSEAALPAFFSLLFFLAQSLFENPLFSIHILPLFLLFVALRLQYRYG